ncbi:MAG: maleylpyruvate isomerase family mycothiol-dependent enzyme, partial [Nocardioidaceae bacterium]
MNAVSRPSTTVDLPEDYAAAAERFAAAVGATDLRAPVPACPGWSAYDLVVHLGNVHAWAATIVETGRRAAEQNDRPRSSRARSVREWYLAKAEDLYQVLRCIPSDRPCWNFVFGEGVADFWRRRQLHETTVHRIDLDVVAGRVSDPAPEVAVDGVSEVLEVMLTRALQRGHRLRLDAPVQLVATDTGDSWVVSPLQRSRPGVPRESSGSPPGRRA